MVESLYFIKKLTTAEAETENNNVHEIYIRLTNDFDYETFFKSKAYLNSSNNPEITFKAIDLTYTNIQKEYDLRFVYYKNSNKEKRIPSMRAVFAEHGVKAGDIVCLESRTKNGETKFYLTFNRNIEFPSSGDFFYYRKTYNSINQLELYKTLSVEQREKVFAFYVKCLDKSKIGEDQIYKYVHTYIPHINKYVQGVENYVTLYEICSLEDFEKVQKKAAKDKNPDPNYLAAYQSSFNKYGRMLSELLSPECRMNMMDFGATENSPKEYGPLQQIFYGAPGTGKSHEIDKKTEAMPKDSVFRTTFHPDSDYSTFVGAYKPTMQKAKKQSSQKILDYNSLVDKFKEYLSVTPMNITKACTLFGYDYHDSIVSIQNYGKTIPELVTDAYKGGSTYDSQVRAGMSVYESNPLVGNSESKIVYTFVKQAFLKAYLKAWSNLSENAVLVIEEINRGNCAQIFGDIFQLLDRNVYGYSDYPINADEDLCDMLQEEFSKMSKPADDVIAKVNNMYSKHFTDIVDKIWNGEVLLLPDNLFIWATMNTSDQSLFPIDSAFKRRWDWKYMPIDTEKEPWSISVKGKSYSWSSFLKKINHEIQETTSSEDKMLGFYFCKAEDGVISAERFVSKVLFYLYNDVFKDYGLDSRPFFKNKENGDKVITFQSLYKSDDGSVNKDLVEKLLINLEVEEGEFVVNEEKDAIDYTSDAKTLQLNFWTEFDKYRINNAAFQTNYNNKVAPHKSPYWILDRTSYVGFYPYLAIYKGRNVIKVSIDIDLDHSEIFDRFKSKETEIKNIIGIDSVEFKQWKKGYMVSVVKEHDLSDATKNTDAFDWLMNNAIKIREVIKLATD